MTQAYHTLIAGSSGGGKSTLARQAHAEFRGPSAFLTTKSRGRESGVQGHEVSGRKALDTATKQADRWERLRVKWYNASYPEATHAVRRWAHDVADYSGYPVQVIVDECQETPLSDSEGALKEGLHQDRDVPIKWVPVTQSPQDLKESRGYAGINQCQYITWVGPAMTFHKGFIEYYSLKGKLPREKYRYHVVRPTNPPTVIHRGVTEKRYG